MLSCQLAAILALASYASCAPFAQDTASSTDSSSTDTSSTDASSGRGHWSVLANITSNGQNFPRQEHSVVSVGTDVYAIGGILPFDGTTYPTVAKVQKYSTTSNTWTDLPDMPTALNHANVAVVNGKIYVCGGLAPTAQYGPLYWQFSGSCSYYTPSTNSWTTLPDMPSARAVGAAATVAYGNTIYFAGGLKYTNLTNDAEGTVTLFTSYNTATGQWTNLPAMPAPRDHAGKGIVDSTLYVLGGRAFGHYNVVNTVYSYNVNGNSWKSGLAPMPTARGGVASGTIGCKIYIAGGEGDLNTPTQVFPQMQAYDTSANTWSNLTDMTRPVHGTAGAAVNGKVYIPGGANMIGGAPVAWNSAFTP